MTIGTIADIRTKFRKLTGAGNSLQITDGQIDDLINSFYSYDLPAQFRSLKLKERYTFNTQRGRDTYAFDSENYTTVEMPCTVSKRPVQLFNDPWNFFTINYNWQYTQNFATGDGSAGGPYTGTVTNTPIIRSFNTDPTTNPRRISYVQNILITANVALGTTLNVTDDGTGVLVGDCTVGSTIDYDTGAISVTFTANVPSGEDIQIQYSPTQMSIPQSILFFQNNITLRPVPDRGYTVEMVAYRKPAQALSNSNSYYPELTEWWELLAVGAAKKFYENQMDPDGVQMMDKILRERYDVAETRTYAQIETQRVSTIYANQLQYGYGLAPNAFGSGG